jgi:hypothetical protein
MAATVTSEVAERLCGEEKLCVNLVGGELQLLQARDMQLEGTAS